MKEHIVASYHPEQAGPQRSAKLLLVDDDSADREVLRRVLSAAGFDAEIEEAGSASAAMARLRAGDVDCALVDYDLPRGDALRVLRQVREHGIDTPIIMLTGSGDEETAVDLMKAGAADYLPRSTLSAEKLVHSLRHALRVRAAEVQARAAAETLRRYLRQLRSLADAAIEINAAKELESLLSIAARQARIIIGAHQAAVTLAEDEATSQRRSVSLSEKYAEYRSLLTRPDRFGIDEVVRRTNRTVRLTRAELSARPAVAPSAENGGPGTEDADAAGDLPVAGWLAAPLRARSRANVGVIHVSDRVDGEFTSEDEAVLVQLAQLAAVAIENVRLYDATRQAAHARERVLAMVSHDLRNPLNTIVMGTSLLIDTPLPPHTSRKQLLAIQRSADAMNRMIQDLLDVTRMEAGRLTVARVPIASRDLAERACEMMEALAREKELRIECNAPASLPSIVGDSDRLLQVFSNLIGNAIKFTEPGGHVAVDARGVGDEVRFAVSDTGPGIEAENLMRIFEPFWQAQHSTWLGTGLGLPIARGIVEAHGGRIWAQSVPGDGSTFFFTIPVGKGPVPEEDAQK